MTIRFPDFIESFKLRPFTLTGLFALHVFFVVYYSYKYDDELFTVKSFIGVLSTVFGIYAIAFFVAGMLEIWAGRIVAAVHAGMLTNTPKEAAVEM